MLIKCEDNEFELTINKGIAYQSITFANLTQLGTPKLEVFKNGQWIKAKRADHYQVDYNRTTKTWEVTYSLSLDDESNCKYRFMTQPK